VRQQHSCLLWPAGDALTGTPGDSRWCADWTPGDSRVPGRDLAGSGGAQGHTQGWSLMQHVAGCAVAGSMHGRCKPGPAARALCSSDLEQCVHVCKTVLNCALCCQQYLDSLRWHCVCHGMDLGAFTAGCSHWAARCAVLQSTARCREHPLTCPVHLPTTQPGCSSSSSSSSRYNMARPAQRPAQPQPTPAAATRRCRECLLRRCSCC